jgi:ferric-dicitrate binding protein FerR (iron transport regulator)
LTVQTQLSETGATKLPFIVDANGVFLTEVLGTHFNVNAYRVRAPIKVTLLEGSVKVKSEVAGHKSETSYQTRATGAGCVQWRINYANQCGSGAGNGMEEQMSSFSSMTT